MAHSTHTTKGVQEADILHLQAELKSLADSKDPPASGVLLDGLTGRIAQSIVVKSAPVRRDGSRTPSPRSRGARNVSVWSQGWWHSFD